MIGMPLGSLRSPGIDVPFRRQMEAIIPRKYHIQSILNHNTRTFARGLWVGGYNTCTRLVRRAQTLTVCRSRTNSWQATSRFSSWRVGLWTRHSTRPETPGLG